jgi:hypothetical protein
MVIGNGLVYGNGIELGLPFDHLLGGQIAGRVDVCISAVPIQRVRETRNNGKVLAIRIQCFLTLPELEALPFSFGEPIPVLVLRIIGWRQTDSVWEKDESRTFGQFFESLVFFAYSHRIQERKAQ